MCLQFSQFSGSVLWVIYCVRDTETQAKLYVAVQQAKALVTWSFIDTYNVRTYIGLSLMSGRVVLYHSTYVLSLSLYFTYTV